MKNYKIIQKDESAGVDPIASEDVKVRIISCIEGISKEKAEKKFEETDFVSIAHIIDYENVKDYSAKAELKKVDGVGDVLADRVVSALVES